MITIDANGKTLGRVASAAAKALLGKHSADFAKNIVAEGGVTIINASKVKISGAKMRDKSYVRYSGYPGGQKEESYAQLTARRGETEAIRRAVLGMLPKNRLQTPRMKMLTIEK
ncbi:MAG TPA: 50S ribosomal protein L13 [Candidatus Paceibacterota bacterium]|nr:50S ribosomal protein L13 [Candidatus Paceibacterota bacterium]